MIRRRRKRRKKRRRSGDKETMNEDGILQRSPNGLVDDITSSSDFNTIHIKYHRITYLLTYLLSVISSKPYPPIQFDKS